MEKMLNDLCECVDRQLELYSSLLDLFKDERQALLASDLESLNRVIVDKERILQQIRREEVQRRQVADEVARKLGVAAEALTISRLGDALSGLPGADRIKQKGGRLKALTEEIQVESERNRSLCLHALQFVGSSIKMLTNLTRPNQVYHASGRVQNGGQIGRMLSGAV
jgi:flagellar biosynthesis/type III secretory pathway chaperone